MFIHYLKVIYKLHIDMEARIIKKGRGLILLNQGYMYSRDRTGPGGKTYWRCTRKPRGSCRARLHIGYTSIMKDDLCKKATTNPTKQLKELYRDYVNSEERPNQDDEDFMVPTLNSCRSQMYRARRRNMPTLPKTRAEINLRRFGDKLSN